jgi:hypothetical protein
VIFIREVSSFAWISIVVDYKQVIGLENKQVDSMIVIWPDRSYSKYGHPELNKVHVVQQPSQVGSWASEQEQTLSSVLLDTMPVVMDKHAEDDYIDFYYERNLPELLSREGPHLAKGDVNGDGLEDVYIGGARDQPGQLYLQTEKGFVKKEEPVFKQYADFEDVAVLFFDADGDGDLDLFIGAGGNNERTGSRELQHRLYKNDGKGNFEIDTRAFPNNYMNISVAVANDYDEDGDIDLFIGSRSVPYAYGITPQSYLFQNDGSGHFTDVGLGTDLSKAGMITGAAWADVTGDGKKELVMTGEWMSTRIFSYNKAKKNLKN